MRPRGNEDAFLRQRQGRFPGPVLEVVPSPADRVAGHPEYRQDRADNEHDDADGPDDGDFRDEADNEQDYAENNHWGSWGVMAADAGGG